MPHQLSMISLCFFIPEAETRQKLLRNVKKEVSAFSICNVFNDKLLEATVGHGSLAAVLLYLDAQNKIVNWRHREVWCICFNKINHKDTCSLIGYYIL